MTYLIIAIIAFYLFGLSLCIAAGRADESAETLERELEPHGLIARRKHQGKAPTFSSRRRRFNSNFARSN
jgi:hypothetical protein